MTKIQQKRREAYRLKLAACGFRSWKTANQRRGELIEREVSHQATESELVELENLQALCDLYLTWKTNDSTGRQNRRLERLLGKLERNVHRL